MVLDILLGVSLFIGCTKKETFLHPPKKASVSSNVYEESRKIGIYFRDNREYDKAISLYESASADNKYACYNLGEIHEKGYGVPRNLSKAKEWYLKAKEMGHYNTNEALKRLSKKGY